MLIRTQNGYGLVNLDNVLHLYATEHGSIMARTVGDTDAMLGDYATRDEAAAVIEMIQNAYLDCNVTNETQGYVKNTVFQIPATVTPKPFYSRR